MPPTLRRRVRPRPPAAEPIVAHGANRKLPASAQRYNLKDRKSVKATVVPSREWQKEAWQAFDEVPEIKYSVRFEGNIMAKMRLFIAVRNPDDPEATPIPITDPGVSVPVGLAQRAQAELDRLKNDLGSRAELIRALNMNLEVTGEAHLVGWAPREVPVKDANGDPAGTEIVGEQWEIYSVSAVREKDGRFTVKRTLVDNNPRVVDESKGDDILRIYQRHPEWTLEADCNMRGVLSDCEALTLLLNEIKADAKSRMGAGWLLIPNELSGGPDIETEPEDGEEAAIDPMLQDIYDGAVEPIEDPSSAAAVAPVFIRGNAEYLKEFRLVERQRVPDPKVLEKISMEIERVARGMNLPVETVMGHQQTTYANAAQVKADQYEDHFQPRCELICDALTVGYLRPNLIAAGFDPGIVDEVLIFWDPSKMIVEVNPADSADKGIELDVISSEAWRRAKGWSEDDQPDPVERLVRAVMHLGRFDPGLSTAILELLGVPLEIPESLPSSGSGTPAPAAPAGEQAAAASATTERALAAAITARYARNGDLGKETLDRMLGELLEADPTVGPLLRLQAATTTRDPARNVGHDLMQIDRDLRAKLIVAADTALGRALEKAGNRLRSKAGKERTLAAAAKVHSAYVAATLGPHIVAAAGFTDDDLISRDAWNGLEQQYRTWVAGAQQRALAIAGKIVTLTAGHRDTLRAGQGAALDESWGWFRDELHTLATRRLYAPDPAAPAVGEFDATTRVPAGLVRQAIARAGGATSITPVVRTDVALRAAPGGDAVGTPIYVAVNNDQPLGGIGTGETISGALVDGGAGIDGYQWDYGPAYRAHPFEEHLALDGIPFQNFDDDVLAAGDWIGDYYFPGDHDGCVCDITPVWLDPGELAAASDQFPTEADQAAADERATPIGAG